MKFVLTKEQPFVREMVRKYGSKIKLKTNYERIVNYNIDEMAKFLAVLTGGGKVEEKGLRKWLEEESTMREGKWKRR